MVQESAADETVQEGEDQADSEEPAAAGGPVDDGPPPPCPPCKSGAPGWMATFADMATLLMAFFVLLLSFAEMNVPKYKHIAGSMKAAFGVKRVVPVISIPTARSLVKEEFTPAVAQNTVIDKKRQRSEEITRENVIKKSADNTADFATEQALRKLEEVLSEEINRGQVVVGLVDDKFVVALQSDRTSGGHNSSDKGQGNGGSVSQETLDIAAKVVQIQTEIATEIEVRKQPLASGLDAMATSTKTAGRASFAGVADSKNQDIEDQYQQIRMSLAAEIQRGLAEVEREGDNITIRLASQGSFVSGSADLQLGFIKLLGQVGKSLRATKGKVRVEGHTDNVPIAFSQRFNSNWDLSAARSASVADFFINNTGLSQDKMTVAGFADTKPIDTNKTAAGRSRNRRIEVIIDGS